MNASGNTSLLRRVAVALLLAGVTGCAPHSDIEISKRYEVGSHPSAECLDAAKRATYWCERGVPRSDPDAQSKCSKARWDHARAC